MRSIAEITFTLMILTLALLSACGRATRQKDLFWRGELWDGMNRMVFTLQDLGFELQTVDSDKGLIVAEMSSSKGQRSNDAGGDAGKICRILIQFPEASDHPIRISAALPQRQDTDSAVLKEWVSEISKRFAWYGGAHVEVRDRKVTDGD